MKQTAARVYARLYRIKTIFCKTGQKISSGTSKTSNQHDNSSKICDDNKQSKSSSFIHTSLDDTISSISGDSIDSGISTLSNSSYSPLLPKSCHIRCDPSIINYVSHNLVITDRSQIFLDDTLFEHKPLAESSRCVAHDQDQTLVVNDDCDEQTGPLTSTMIDRWYSITKSYIATFRQDLTVRKYECVQVLRSTHPHWIWVRNERNDEGFIPSDCLLFSPL
ncbi:unnamed protein product [Adineta ricciae]|uniref:SH3 domain-containing protein n=1 Tax=Adineta ricciae TaxID=249248 RepID=A0A815DUB8_ADIRI|nr:unnamed protein product [Adineta ricciae]CAF1302795.1 unnamed protein product [Adineta ricciae]